MTEEKRIERLKDDLRNYTLCYDWWGQFGVDYVKKMLADNKEEWIKILQEEWNNKPWWLYKTENPSFFAKFIRIISKYITRYGAIGTGKDYLYDIDEQLNNYLRRSVYGLSSKVDTRILKFEREQEKLKDSIEILRNDTKDIIKENVRAIKLRTIDYRLLIADYDLIYDYEFIACYVFNKVEQYNKLKLEE